MDLPFWTDEKTFPPVDFFIEKGADNWNRGMGGAARGGQRDLVDFFIEKGANYWDGGMAGAAHGGHRDLVDFFIVKGADDWKLGMLLGATKDLVEFFKQKMQ